MLPQWVIEKKRDGKALSREEIEYFINGYGKKEIPDYQMSALAMAIYFQGMNSQEVLWLVKAMMSSGQLLNTGTHSRPMADKHSTGGVGDKISLILAPLVACFGIAVPMICGRGLGITGGTLDKLESIPGYRTDLSAKEFNDVVEHCGCAITGQSEQLVPVDRMLYALRDVTATVPSIPLITASIMSKKMAEGVDALVLDVKCGLGAFMKSMDTARALACAMMDVGRTMGKKVSVLITNMNQPLGQTVGNALEIMEAIETLRGRGPADVVNLTVALSSEMIRLARPEFETGKLEGQLLQKLRNGEAYSRFQKMVAHQGGDTAALENITMLPAAAIVEVQRSPATGYVTAVDADAIGRACIVLGAGRIRTEDPVDPAVGVADLVKIGAYIQKGQPLARIHANQTRQLDDARKLIASAFQFHREPPRPETIILEAMPCS